MQVAGECLASNADVRRVEEGGHRAPSQMYAQSHIHAHCPSAPKSSSSPAIHMAEFGLNTAHEKYAVHAHLRRRAARTLTQLCGAKDVNVPGKEVLARAPLPVKPNVQRYLEVAGVAPPRLSKVGGGAIFAR